MEVVFIPFFHSDATSRTKLARVQVLCFLNYSTMMVQRASIVGTGLFDISDALLLQ